jgi:hypothetical protein
MEDGVWLELDTEVGLRKVVEQLTANSIVTLGVIGAR